MWPFTFVSNLRSGAAQLKSRRYGVIEMQAGKLVGVHLRPWPKNISVFEIWLLGGRTHLQRPGDRCWLYYNQPMGHSTFLTLKYVVSHRDTTYRTFRGSLTVLDEIARLKNSHAALCEVSNSRISDRLLTRLGWESHVPDSKRRHFIKRYYGEFPNPQTAWKLEQKEEVGR